MGSERSVSKLFGEGGRRASRADSSTAKDLPVLSFANDVWWLQRFTLRTAKSAWSKINRAKVEALVAAGTMEAPGLAEVERAKRDGRWDRAYDGARSSSVPADLVAAFARNPRARAFFETLDGTNRYAILYRVQTAKKPETRAERITRFVATEEHWLTWDIRLGAASSPTSSKKTESTRLRSATRTPGGRHCRSPNLKVSSRSEASYAARRIGLVD